MARRMFTDEITSSDAFLDMPEGGQNLYFHLGMNADDDGFIGNPKMIMRAIRSSEDSYKLLIAKKFILPFDSGVCVIKHWKMNNQIRKDRYTETKYLPEKLSLFVKSNGAYTLSQDKGLPVPKGHFAVAEIESGNQSATSRQPSIGKDSIGKDSIEVGVAEAPQTSTKKFQKPTVEEIQDYITEKGYKVDAHRFWHFYESKGWKIGKNPMVSWKSGVATWAKDDKAITKNNYEKI